MAKVRVMRSAMVRRGMVVSYVHEYVEAFYAPHAGEGN
jgi:hypothetical protein